MARPKKQSATELINEVKRRTKRTFSAEEKIKQLEEVAVESHIWSAKKTFFFVEFTNTYKKNILTTSKASQFLHNFF